MSKRRIPVVRRPVALLLSRFPLVTETFILREVIEMERRGQPVRLVPLLRERPATLHEEARPWIERALYTPFLSWGITRANLRQIARRPIRYFRLLAALLCGTAGSPAAFVRTAALFPKMVYLAERLSHEGIGHVHAHYATYPATAALVISELAGIPYSLTVHAHDIFVDRALLRRKLAGATFVRTISRFNQQFLARLYPDLAARLRVIHVGVDAAAYAAPAPASGTAVPSVVCVAALKPYKGLPVLIEACRLLRNAGTPFHCDIVGEGPQRRELAAAILRSRLQDDVHLLGARPQHEVARLVPSASVFVLPSVVAPDGQMEGIPVALMEAMAAGRPVIASALSGIPELIEDGVTGVLVPPGDAARLAEAIQSLTSDAARARKLGERARETVRREFRLDAVVAELLARIDECTPLDARLAARLAAATRLVSAAPCLGVRRVHEGGDSMVAELLVPGLARPAEIAFKVHRPRPGESAPAPERARREFEALRRLQATFAEAEGLGVPRVLHLDGDAVAMELCGGTPLDALVRRARRGGSGTALEASLARVGGWLRVFQGATARRTPATAALDRLVARAQGDLDACAAAGLSRASARRIGSRLDALAVEARPFAGSLVGRHGDFWPGNVYVGEDEVQVIDFEGIGEGHAAEDVAYFLVQLELFHACPGLGRAGERMAQAFRDGYGADVLHPSAYALCRAAAVLQVLRRSPEATRGLRGWWRRRALQRLLLTA